MSVLIREPPWVGEICNLTRMLHDIGVADVVATPSVDEAAALLDEAHFDVFFFGLENAGDAEAVASGWPALTSAIDIVIASPLLSAAGKSLVEDLGDGVFVELPATHQTLQTVLARVSRRAPRLSANIEGLSVPDILQLYHQSRQTLEVTIEGPISGVVAFVDGEMTYVSCDDGRLGIHALSRLMIATEGHIHTNTRVRRPTSRMSLSFPQALLEAAMLIDRPQAPHADASRLATTLTEHEALEPKRQQGDRFSMVDGQALASSLHKLEREVTGFIGASVVDIDSGMTLASHSSRSDFDLSVASANNSEMVKQKVKTIAALGLKTDLEDMLLTLGTQLHLIRLISPKQFLYLAADKSMTNLALMRNAVGNVIDELM